MNERRTVVLVHGAWHDGSSWRRVVPLLEAMGHRVLAPSLTGHGDRTTLLGPGVTLATHVQVVVDLIESEDLSDVVLVGHSYSGMVISGVAHRVPERLAEIVYLDAMVPVHGESALDVVPGTRFLIDAASVTDTPWRIPVPPVAPPPRGLFGVTDVADLAWLQPTLGPEAVGIFTEAVAMDSPAGHRVARSHIHCVDFEPDGFVRRPVPALQPNGEPARVLRISSGHDCMIIAPEELATMLDHIAVTAPHPAR